LIAMARASKIPMLDKFANTLSAHRTGVLAYFDHRISTGPLEGTNNKIKVRYTEWLDCELDSASVDQAVDHTQKRLNHS
jgi:hypothetical protein